MVNQDSCVRRVLIAVGLVLTNNAQAEFAFNLPEPVSPLTKDVFDLHMMTAYAGLYIMIIVTSIVIYALIRFRKSAGYKPDQKFHSGWFGTWSWVLVPIIVLGIDLSIAGPASITLGKVDKHIPPDLTVKVTGSQWKWTYEYLDEDIKIVSNLLPLEKAGERYLRDVDEAFVLPVNTQIRFLHTAADVLHAWWVPAIAVKKDSIPGYINETYTYIEKEGTYYGQCAENCGTGHAFMPIKVEAVSKEEFSHWLDSRKTAAAVAAAEAASNRVWTLEELLDKGEKVYQKNCVACHGANGAGVSGVFPALKGSPVATGPKAGHMDIVINGKAGTAMAAWGTQLNDLELAAVITFERNAWGNNTGETLQPADITQARGK
jgi:cytochrome c oxidase subunit 2